MKRLFWLSLPTAFLLVLAIALQLEPHPSGMGTHRSLGLPPCLFLALTGFLCPSCGLTTSFVHLAQGHLVHSFSAHPLGPILFSLFALLSLYSLLEFFGKQTPLGKFLNGHYIVWVYGGVFLFLTTWGVRLMMTPH